MNIHSCIFILSPLFFERRVISNNIMKKYRIKMLNKKFYNDYPHKDYPELLLKEERPYNIVVFEVDCLRKYDVCIPFRTEMNHNNGYKFKRTRKSKNNSGLDFSKLVLGSKDTYLGKDTRINNREYLELEKYHYNICKNLERYILDYVNHVKGIKLLHNKEFERRYKYSTLKYFHNELQI